MKIVTDAAANLGSEKAARLGVQVVPFQVTFMGRTYRDGVDITPEELYRLYTENPDEFSATSQPSAGDFVDLYQKIGPEEIFSIHLSSGLSGTISSAEQAANIAAGPQVTVFDSKMVGPALGWMVQAATRGAKLGWPKERILETMHQLREHTLTMVTFTDMKYLLHSGRVSHLRGFIGALLRIKPVIGMNPVDGRYTTLAQEFTASRAIQKMAEIVQAKYGRQKVHLQLMHGSNLPGVEQLRKVLTGMMDCVEDALVPVTLVLGAHAGPTVIGLAAVPQSVYENLIA
jgi:DegV family protein with EDD domain